MLFPGLSLPARAVARCRATVAAWLVPYLSGSGAVPSLVLDYAAGLYAVGGQQVAQPVTGARLGPRAVDGLGQGVIVDPARSNLVTQSVATAAGWSIIGSTQRTQLSENAHGLFPGLEVVSEGQNWHRAQPPSGNFAANVPYAVSVWYRAGSSGRMRCILYSGATNPVTSVALAGTAGAVTLNTSSGATISNVENLALGGGYHLLRFVMMLASAVSATAFGVGPDSTVSGQSVIVHAMQVEQAVAPSGYIGTSGSVVARAADTAGLAGGGWLAAPEGTLLLRARLRCAGEVPLARLSGAGDALDLYRTAGGKLRARFGGAPGLLLDSAASVPSHSDVAIALGWSGSGMSLCLSGGVVATAGGAEPSALNRLDFAVPGVGAGAGPALIRAVRFYPKRLSDAELQGLTA
ncbi:hypothetical protein [Sedimentimonas flavescens]|uniref:phage head spike fiber domain-containing protein n=1 Tax=Sedimentimonas flavescens TaxID=2851012 RepID=UPI001C49D7CF|nr:hypothetical protein [Sedimentimonas flavescens]MBW0157489.1 hypothetical protein [Sedimentimonas flavescens]